MLLMAVDIGNTNVVIGFIDDGRIAGTYRITTKANHTSDEYGLMITQFLALSGYKPADVDDVIISSVVPKVMHSFRASIVKFLDIDPMIVGPGIKRDSTSAWTIRRTWARTASPTARARITSMAGRFWWLISARPPRSITSPGTRR